MKVLMSYIRLVRPFNLIIIAFTLYMIRWVLFYPPKSNSPVSELAYALFSFSFICMAAGGYIINDYYDIEIDKINKPGKVIIGDKISVRSALLAYWAISIAGIIGGVSISYLARVPLLGLLFVFYLVALWFYSYKLKSTFLLGNLLIGICIALVPLGGACIELCASNGSATFSNDEKAFVGKLIFGIAVFAFLSTLIREIVKDVEDMEGDAIAGCRTMPVVVGVTKTKWIIFSLLVIVNILLGYAQYQVMDLGIYPLLYFLVFIQVPLVVIMYRLFKAKIATDYHTVSNWLKVLMLTGIMYVFFLALEVYTMYQFFMLFFKHK